MVTPSPTFALDPAEHARIRSRFFALIWDQLKPWAYMDTDGLQIRRHDGTMISFDPAMFDGAPRQVLWETNYIEPFLEVICREETAKAATLPQRQREALREVLRAGIERVYLTMQEIDWHMIGDGVAEHYDKHDTEAGVARMTAYLDRCLTGADARAA